jgi:hypothetical protein
VNPKNGLQMPKFNSLNKSVPAIAPGHVSTIPFAERNKAIGEGLYQPSTPCQYVIWKEKSAVKRKVGLHLAAFIFNDFRMLGLEWISIVNKKIHRRRKPTACELLR